MAEELELPEDYEDDLYHCEDPYSNQNLIRCDPATFLWDVGDLNPVVRPDNSLLCTEIVKILVRAREEDGLEPGQPQEKETEKEVQLWETIMETSVVDQMEPCILWAMSYGPLTPWAASMGFDEDRYKQNEVTSTFGDNEENFDVNEHMETDENGDPISSMMETEFDPFMIALAWSSPLPEPLSLDRTELHELTGRHMLDALKAEVGPGKVAHLGLTVTAGLPDYDAQILPLTLSGKVVFLDHREALGSSTLQKLLMQTTFVDENARDLYLFRLRISKDSVLQMVSTVVAGKDNIADYAMGEPSRIHNDKKSPQQLIDTNLSDADQQFVSRLLVAILSAVGAAIIAVVCFAYFLIFRSRASGNVIKTLEEHSSNHGSSTSFRKVSNKNAKQSFRDGIPAVKTAPTEEAAEEEESQYDIEYMAGSNDGISEYDMDTLPPPSTFPDSDDDHSVVMSVMEGFDDENPEGPEETVAGLTQTDASDDNTSLYSYIPTDTSLGTNEESSLKKAQKKGLLWSVEKQAEAPIDSDTDDYGFSAEQESYTSKTRTSMLGPPSDTDSHSRDSNSLLYATDDEDLLLEMAKPKTTEIPVDYDPEDAPPIEEHPPIVESASSDEPGDKKKKFEDLWKDENEVDEAASVLNYLDSVQSARRSADEEPEVAPTSSLKIIDVATPVQTPERPPRPEGSNLQVTADQLVEALVDMVPADTSDDQMNVPLPATLDGNMQDTGSVSSSLSGSSSTYKQRGESVRTKKTTSTWTTASPSAASSDNSVRSTDSAMLRSLLGQGDMNDAALFGKETQKDDTDSSGNSTPPDMEGSMTSCTSNKLKSLLTTADSRDAGSDDEEDFLFTNNKNTKEVPYPSRKLEEEKKDADTYNDEEDDEDDRRTSYLPSSITPRGQQVPAKGLNHPSPDDASVTSALSEAPSVDETIASNMGWF